MEDEEIALRLVENYTKDKEINMRDKYWDIYVEFLEKIKKYKSNTIKGKIENELKKFDSSITTGISFYDYQCLVKNIREILKEN